MGGNNKGGEDESQAFRRKSFRTLLQMRVTKLYRRAQIVAITGRIAAISSGQRKEPCAKIMFLTLVVPSTQAGIKNEAIAKLL